MKQADHNHTFTATDIQRYHAGEMSMQERHALEKAALDDPFLADALEGYQFTANPQVDIAALKQQLIDKAAPQHKKVYPVSFRKPGMRVAAMALALAGAGWLVYQFSFNQKEELAIQPEVSQPRQKLGSSKTTAITPKPDSPTSTQTDVAQVPPLTTTPEKRALIAVPTQKPAAKADKIEADEINTMPAPVSISSAPAENKLSLRAADESAKKEVAASSGISKDQLSSTLHTFKGQVLDASGQPVPNASVIIAGKQTGTITDMQGQFFLTTPDSTLNATVSAAGFEANRLSFNNPGEEKRVTLNESNASLSEVVITGYGTRKNRSTARPSAAQTKAEVEELEPENGWSTFNNYITQNIQIPEEVTNKQLKGDVELAFEVNRKGEPVNIRVEKSLCASCDKEAVRLLQEGPSWKKKKKKNGKVKIHFW